MLQKLADERQADWDAVESAEVADRFPEESFEDKTGWFDPNTQAFVVSFLFHLVLILALAVVPIVSQLEPEQLFIASKPVAEEDDEFEIVEDFAVSEEPSTQIGANSAAGESMALSMAPVLAELSELPSPSLNDPVPDATYEMNNLIEKAVGLVRSETVVKGMTGVGATGTDGAVDRITYELLRSMEERPTLVVWYFDQSGSLLKRRQEVRDRFDRIYTELGILADREIGDTKEEPLLTAIYGFGEKVELLTPKPTADINEIRATIDQIQQDSSGVERVFSALYSGVEKFKRYRSSRTGLGPARNIVFIAVTDERGDDANGLDATIKECVKYAIPVYVVGVPAPFGRETTFVKYVDPDPKFDQTPQWAAVDQGPESILPERVKLGFRDDFYNEPVVDSGFGPYALSRLCYETGGIYFTVHPNRKVGRRLSRGQISPFAARLEYFFDPETMAKYRPDYVGVTEYMKRVSESPLRQVLTSAARMPRVQILAQPTVRFVKRSEAGLVTELTQSQQLAARVEPGLRQMVQVLKQGEEHLDSEISPRWRAGFELALGRTIVHKVRAETYNLMLAKAKRGMSFEKEKNNTWVLKPSDEVSVGSRLAKEGQLGREMLETVANSHKGTPWGLIAERELRQPVGWSWEEEFTDLNPPPQRRNNNNNNNNNPRPPRDDQKRMLKKPPPKRPIPKL